MFPEVSRYEIRQMEEYDWKQAEERRRLGLKPSRAGDVFFVLFWTVVAVILLGCLWSAPLATLLFVGLLYGYPFLCLIVLAIVYGLIAATGGKS